MQRPLKIIACRALSQVVEQFALNNASLTVLDIALHLQPDRLRKVLLEKIKEIEEEKGTILLGYGLCGRALEGVFSEKCTLILPRVDDCVGIFMGSRKAHQSFLKRKAGSFFLEKSWLNSEINIFEEMGKGLEHLSSERRKQIVSIALKHYSHLIFLKSSDGDEKDSIKRCEKLAEKYNLKFEKVPKRIDLIRRLIYGPWDDENFLIIPPGKSVPLF